MGASVVAVGFGEADDALGWGPKRAVTMNVNSIAGGEAFIGGGGKDTCYGDSGGPVFIQLSDQSWRVFGITSYGEYCGGGGYYSMMHTALDWLEQASGVDLTPCYDQGQWSPGPDCGGFPLDPNQGGGSWSVGCGTGNVSAMSATCGPAFDTGAGGEPSTGGASSGGAGPVGGGGGSETGGAMSSGCSSAPDCASCGDCVSDCICLTGDASGCNVACQPNAQSSGSGAASAGDVDRSSEPPNGASCGIRARRTEDSTDLIVALSMLVGLGRRRMRKAR